MSCSISIATQRFSKYKDVIADDANHLLHYVTEGTRRGFLANKTEEVEISMREDANPADIVFKPHADKIDVSVIVPSYKQNDFTLRCLKSLSTHQSRYRLEVIVVDDCSPDDTEEKLGDIQGLPYFKNAENMGFVMTYNRGIAEARGEFIVLCIPFSTQLQKSETPFGERRDLVFVGGYSHQPNADAVVYFVREVLPLIKMNYLRSAFLSSVKARRMR
jgi:cellulose synthase/poly-beta-1,6-N-acetylglucosamine synthase-like glycosyltransferase